jgi:putative sterol carrier protein
VDPDDLDEFEPAYRIQAPYSVWKGFLLGTLDPVEAVLRRRVQVQGDLQPLVERMQHKGLAERVLAKMKTRFVDEL